MKKTRILIYMILFILIILNAISIKVDATDNYRARTYIDVPTEKMLVNHELEIEGWVMTNDEQAKIEVYIDGEEQEIQDLQRVERPDVLNAITGYGTAEQNPKPGYKLKIDTSKILDGEHRLEVRISSGTGEILTADSRSINLQKFVAKTYIDMPNDANEYLITDELNIEGWIMSDDENYQIKAYINGEEQEIQDLQRVERSDVIKAISGYGTAEQNPKPGYELKIDTSKLVSDSYTLEIRVISRTGEKLVSVSKKVIIQRYTSRSYIDSPESNKILKPDSIITGWIMTNDENSTIKVYLDGQEQTIKSIDRQERDDVIKAISGYGGIEKNPKPGFDLILEPSNISDGKHVLKINNVSREGKIISTSTQTIYYENYKAKTYIDNPPDNKTTIYEDSISIRGWLMTDDINSTIKVYIDGQEQTIKNINREEREDVIKAISGYGGAEKNPKPGYEILLDMPQNIKDGKHTLRVDIVSSTGKVIATNTRSIEINKYKAKGYIDNPVSMQQAKNTLSVSGWVMSTDENVQIKMYINNKEQQMDEFEREEREDVIKAISGYGGIEKNPKPGYKATIDIKGFSDGVYTLRVEAISSEGEIMCVQNQSIVIYNSYAFGIDVSYHNGTIDWGKVKNHGVDFAMIRAGFRGYGQSGSLNMDTQFVANMKGAIANNIDVGIYFFTQAITVEEAVEEADYVIKLLKENGFENNLTFPIVIDTEEIDNADGRADSLTKEIRTLIVGVFCERIKQYGYTPMIYANKWWLMDKLDMNQLTDYDVWLAHYTNTNDPINNPSDYTGNYQMWQYTDSGQINGISTNVDLNICYKKYL